jgi:hypothetical protein
VNVSKRLTPQQKQVNAFVRAIVKAAKKGRLANVHMVAHMQEATMCGDAFMWYAPTGRKTFTVDIFDAPKRRLRAVKVPKAPEVANKDYYDDFDYDD